jgi:hypothetical protein
MFNAKARRRVAAKEPRLDPNRQAGGPTVQVV